jgi:hypothetical protein
MESILDGLAAVLEVVGAVLLKSLGVCIALSLLGAWCMLVFFLTGRFPWFVRKYF